MASTGTQSHTVTTPAQPVSYRRPLAIVALLFFIFGLKINYPKFPKKNRSCFPGSSE
jgi:hypothetical protein